MLKSQRTPGKFIWRDGKWMEIERHPGPPPKPKFPSYAPDIEGYMSPTGSGWIDGRAARKEDLIRNNCREVDPSERPEWNPKTKQQAEAERKQLEERRANPYVMDAETKERLMKGE